MAPSEEHIKPKFKIPPLLKILVKPTLGLLILWLLISRGGLDLKIVGAAILKHPHWIALAFLVQVLLTVLAGVRWYLLLRYGGIRLPFRRVFSLHMIGIFFVTLIPGGTGGDLVKGYYIYKALPDKKGLAISSIIVDRLLGLYVLLLWGCIGGLLNYGVVSSHPVLQTYFSFYAMLFLGATLFVGLCFTPLAGKFFDNSLVRRLPGQKILQAWNHAFQVYRQNKRALLYAGSITFAVHGLIVVVYHFCSFSLEVVLGLVRQSLIVPLMTLINGLPISPGGMGVGEAGAHFLYQLLGVSQGGEIVMLFHLVFFATAICGAPFYFLYKNSRKTDGMLRESR